MYHLFFIERGRWDHDCWAPRFFPFVLKLNKNNFYIFDVLVDFFVKNFFQSTHAVIVVVVGIVTSILVIVIVVVIRQKVRVITDNVSIIIVIVNFFYKKNRLLLACDKFSKFVVLGTAELLVRDETVLVLVLVLEDLLDEFVVIGEHLLHLVGLASAGLLGFHHLAFQVLAHLRSTKEI